MNYNNADEIAMQWSESRGVVLWKKVKPSTNTQPTADTNIMLQKHQMGKEEKNDKKRVFNKIITNNVDEDDQNEKLVASEVVDWSELEFCRYLRANNSL